MSTGSPETTSPIVLATGEAATLAVGDQVTVLTRSPVGHYRVPHYIRGRSGRVERVIEPTMIDNEEEGFGRNAGNRRHYVRVAFPMTALWPKYAGGSNDTLRIEIFENWLERI